MESTTVIDLSNYFERLAAQQGVAGAIGELTAHLASGQAERSFYATVVERYGLQREPWFAPQRLDLLLGFASECLRSRELLHPAQLENLRLLKTFLQVRDGEFLQHRPGEIAHILREQLRIVLSDAVLDAREDVYLVSLQSVFGLGYDSFLSLTRIVFESTWADLHSGRPADGEDATRIEVKKKLLEPIVRLATLQNRSHGALNS